MGFRVRPMAKRAPPPTNKTRNPAARMTRRFMPGYRPVPSSPASEKTLRHSSPGSPRDRPPLLSRLAGERGPKASRNLRNEKRAPGGAAGVRDVWAQENAATPLAGRRSYDWARPGDEPNARSNLRGLAGGARSHQGCGGNCQSLASAKRGRDLATTLGRRERGVVGKERFRRHQLSKPGPCAVDPESRTGAGEGRNGECSARP